MSKGFPSKKVSSAYIGSGSHSCIGKGEEMFLIISSHHPALHQQRAVKEPLSGRTFQALQKRWEKAAHTSDPHIFSRLKLLLTCGGCRGILGQGRRVWCQVVLNSKHCKEKLQELQESCRAVHCTCLPGQLCCESLKGRTEKSDLLRKRSGLCSEYDWWEPGYLEHQKLQKQENKFYYFYGIRNPAPSQWHSYRT